MSEPAPPRSMRPHPLRTPVELADESSAGDGVESK